MICSSPSAFELLLCFGFGNSGSWSDGGSWSSKSHMSSNSWKKYLVCEGCQNWVHEHRAQKNGFVCKKLSYCAQVSRIGPNRQCRAGTRPWGWWLLRFQCRHLSVSQLALEASPDRSTGSGARRGQAELCASSSWESCRHSAPMVDKAGQGIRSSERTVQR